VVTKVAAVVVTDLLASLSTRLLGLQQIRVRSVEYAFNLWLILFLLAFLAFDTAKAASASCDEASGAAAISACDRELAKNPNSIEIRLRYADVLMGQRKYLQAVNILKDALALQPGNNRVKQKYRLANSLAEEHQSIGELSVETPTSEARSSVKEILCKTLKGKRAIDACREVLTADPRNMTALVRLGDELMAINQVEDAVVSYRRAVALDSANPTLQNKLARAESKMPKEQRVVVIETPNKDEAAKAAEKKRKADEARLAEVKRKEEAERERKKAEQRRLAELEQKRKEEAERKLKEAEQRRLAEQEKKRKEAELMARLETSPPEVVVKYSNASLVNGSTY